MPSHYHHTTILPPSSPTRHHIWQEEQQRRRRRNWQHHQNISNSKGPLPIKRMPFNFKLWIKSTYEIATTSLFFSPMLAVVAAIFLGFAMAYLDHYLTVQQGMEPPVILTTTVDSARALLSTVAGATISFAGTAFSVCLLVIQLGSSQYSPRIVHTLFKDPFNRRIVALVVGTFTYCLVVMRSVDSPAYAMELLDQQDTNTTDEQNTTPVVIVPNVSVAVAFVLGIASLLAIVAFIDHSANTMDISQLLERVTRDTIVQIQATWGEEQDHHSDDENDDNNSKTKKNSSHNGNDGNSNDNNNSNENEENPKKPPSRKGEESQAEEMDDCHVVRFRTSGWVQEIGVQALLHLVPPNGYMKVHTLAGRYAIPGTAVCSVYPKPTNRNNYSNNNDTKPDITASANNNEDDDDETLVLDDYDDRVLDSFMIGLSRTMRSDASYGLRQLVDVVLRALSPGVNDPTTAQDGIFHVAAVVTEYLHRVPPKSIMENKEGGQLILNEQQDYDTIVRLGFDEARICAASSPTVALYLLESLRLIRESLKAGGHPHRAPEIERQARLVEACIRNASHVDDDHDFIVKARQDRFDTGITAENMGIRGQLVA